MSCSGFFLHSSEHCWRPRDLTPLRIVLGRTPEFRYGIWGEPREFMICLLSFVFKENLAFPNCCENYIIVTFKGGLEFRFMFTDPGRALGHWSNPVSHSLKSQPGEGTFPCHSQVVGKTEVCKNGNLAPRWNQRLGDRERTPWGP